MSAAPSPMLLRRRCRPPCCAARTARRSKTSPCRGRDARGTRRGEPLRRVRQRPAHGARGLGTARLGRWARVERRRRRGRRRGHTWSVGDEVSAVRRRGAAECEMCRSGRPSLCSDRDTPGTGGDVHRARSPATRVVDEARAVAGARWRLAAGGRADRAARGRAARHHPGRRAARRTGARAPAAGPIGVLVGRRAAGDGRRRRHGERAAAGAPGAARRLGAPTVVAPDELDVPGPFDPARVVAEPFDVALECSGQRRGAWRPALAQLKRARHARARRRGHGRPRFDPNRILLNELVITGAFCTTPTASSARSSCWRRPGFPVDVLIEPDDVAARGRARRHARSRRRARSPPRSSSHPDGADSMSDTTARGPASTTSPCRCRPTRSTTRAAPRSRVLRRRVRLAGVHMLTEDRRRGSCCGVHSGRAVRVPHRRRPADDVPADGPLRHVRRDPRRVRRAYGWCRPRPRPTPTSTSCPRDVENYEGYLKLHNFYVRYKLPMMVEVQHFEYAATLIRSR